METKQKKSLKPLLVIIGLILIAGLGCGIMIFGGTLNQNEPEVVTVSTLEKIINVSELSTFTAVYNGVAEVANTKKPAEIDYYISYEATVKAGINLDDVVVSMDDRTKIIRIGLPAIEITDINVDIGSLDYIFYNEKANQSTVSEQAYKACEADVANETENHFAIKELARQNAVNILTALVNPILEQLGDEYSLEIL